MTSQLIEIKTLQELDTIKKAAQINMEIIKQAGDALRVGMSTKDLDNLIKQLIAEAHVDPAFLNYQPEKAHTPFPSYACICLNHEVFHAPANPTKVIKKGDLVTIDLGIKYNGFYADCADSFVIGDSTPYKLTLIKTCKDAINNALPLCRAGANLRDVTHIIDKTIRAQSYSPIDSYGGHSIGSQLHMAPFISNSAKYPIDCELAEGMTICLEPACSLRWEHPTVEKDGWTVSLSPGNFSAHVERMVSITQNGGVILQ